MDRFPETIRNKKVKSWKKLSSNDIVKEFDFYMDNDNKTIWIASLSYIGRSCKDWLGNLDDYPPYRPVFKERIG